MRSDRCSWTARLGCAGEEGRKVRRDVLAPERGRRGDDEPPRGALRADGERVLRRAQLPEDAVAIFVECGTLGGEGDLARGALEELHAEALLELVDAPPDHRRRDAFLARSGGKAAALRDIDEGRQLLELVHDCVEV